MAELEPAAGPFTPSSTSGGDGPDAAQRRGALPRVIAAPGDRRHLAKPPWAALLQSPANASAEPHPAAPAVSAMAAGRAQAAKMLSSFAAKSPLPAGPAPKGAPRSPVEPPVSPLEPPVSPQEPPVSLLDPAASLATAASAARALTALAGVSLSASRAVTAEARPTPAPAAVGAARGPSAAEGARHLKASPPVSAGPAPRTARGAQGSGQGPQAAPPRTGPAPELGERGAVGANGGDRDILPAARPKGFWRLRPR